MNSFRTIKFKGDKTESTRRVIREALVFLQRIGVPCNGSDRALEKMAMAFLAVGDVKTSTDWSNLKSESSGRSLKTREIIKFENENFQEDISSGSYDDIRRKDLLYLIDVGVVVSTMPDSARNNPSRGYAIANNFAEAARFLPEGDWETIVANFVSPNDTPTNASSLRYEAVTVVITLPTGERLELSPGEHNQLQKAIVEQLLPRFAQGAEVLYWGDAAQKRLHVMQERLESLRFFDLKHGELPDVVAYLSNKSWLFLIEAVCSSGPMSAIRVGKLRTLTTDCTAGIVYITAFFSRKDFRKWVAEIAWETEVWIAEEPDHLIHFNGDRFLGPR
ncbi:MAG: BsuBI/PstI family type II restriction endonuclease [Armatimonadetes bacterium]|nr:BsuBI/PstI family type II restriction endonuclease [Armatimonadota bacterium]